jgi:hypothetical protein
MTRGTPLPKPLPKARPGRGIHALLNQMDKQALEQLRAEASRLAEENDQLRSQLARSEEAAEGWHAEALELQQQLATATGGAPGITQAGALVVLPALSAMENQP